jgi:hypothetical protein
MRFALVHETVGSTVTSSGLAAVGVPRCVRWVLARRPIVFGRFGCTGSSSGYSRSPRFHAPTRGAGSRRRPEVLWRCRCPLGSGGRHSTDSAGEPKEAGKLKEKAPDWRGGRREFNLTQCRSSRCGRRRQHSAHRGGAKARRRGSVQRPEFRCFDARLMAAARHDSAHVGWCQKETGAHCWPRRVWTKWVPLLIDQ